jgi:hypothetical protein
VTLNLSEDAPVPPPPIEGHKWKAVVHDNTVAWLAFWKVPVLRWFVFCNLRQTCRRTSTAAPSTCGCRPARASRASRT